MLQILFHHLGKSFNKVTLRELIENVGIDATDWPKIGRNLLGLHHLGVAFSRGIFARVQERPQEKDKLSWDKVAQTLEGMEGCKAATQKAKKNAGRQAIRNTCLYICCRNIGHIVCCRVCQGQSGFLPNLSMYSFVFQTT